MLFIVFFVVCCELCVCVFFPGMFTYVYMSFFLDNCHLFAGLPCGFVGEADGLWGMDLHGSGVFPEKKTSKIPNAARDDG